MKMNNYAVFDCDGTIIEGDIERLVIKYQLNFKEYRISEQFLKEKFSKYIDLTNLDVISDFRYIVSEIYKKYKENLSRLLLIGYSSEEVFELSKKAHETYPEDVKKRVYFEKLFEKLKKDNVDIYICSSSYLDEVKYVASLYSIDFKNVLATDIKKDKNGKFIDKENGIAVRNDGKVKLINSLKYFKDPLIIAGDSDIDYEMLINFKESQKLIINPKEGSKIFNLIDGKKFVKILI